MSKAAMKKEGYAALGPEENRIRLILQDWYQASGMSQSQVGEKVGLSQTHISAILVGRSALNLNVLPAFCKCFGKAIADLYAKNPHKVSDPETENVMRRYRPLTPAGKKAVLATMEALGAGRGPRSK